LPKPVTGEEIDNWMAVHQEKVTKGTLNILTQHFQRAAEAIKLTPEEKKKGRRTYPRYNRRHWGDNVD
jgi:hypothetical protein